MVTLLIETKQTNLSLERYSQFGLIIIVIIEVKTITAHGMHH